MVALSGGVDSAVAALTLRDAGFDVQCLHMTNWDDGNEQCAAAADFQDARKVAQQLGLPLHRVNFAQRYRERVFEDFLAALRAGRTPNPDVLCNREIKFGAMRHHAARLGAEWLATGHYARLERGGQRTQLLKARDNAKDQTYFLHAVASEDFGNVLFPLGDMHKREVRERARAAGLVTAEKKDSTGICFIGERPFREFLARFLPREPGPIREAGGQTLGRHTGLAFYTLGQRHGLNIGGRAGFGDEPWYVAAKDPADNALIVVQGADHPLLMQDWLVAEDVHWIGEPPADWTRGGALRCCAKTRYRQTEQPCSVTRTDSNAIEVRFDSPQRAVTPGQFVVLYRGSQCLGGATIAAAAMRSGRLAATG